MNFDRKQQKEEDKHGFCHGNERKKFWYGFAWGMLATFLLGKFLTIVLNLILK